MVSAPSDEAEDNRWSARPGATFSWRRQPDGVRSSYRRLPVATVAFLMFLVTMASNAPSPLYVIYQQKFHFSALTVTAVFGAYAGAVIVALLTVGRLSDVIGRRKMLAPALVLLGVSSGLFAAAQGTVWLFAARAVQGFATGVLTGAATAALVELEPNEDRQRASYINTIMFIAGAAGGPLLFGIAAQYFPAPLVSPFLIEAGLVVIGLAGVWVLPETVFPRRRVTWQLQRVSVPRPILAPFVVAILALCVSWGIGSLYGALSATIDKDLLHVRSHAMAGVVLFMLSAVGGASQLALRRRPPRWSIIVGAAAAAAGLSLVYVGLAASLLPVFFVGTVLSGAGSGLAFMGSLAMVNDVAPPARRAEVISAWNLIGYVALSAPAIGVGLLSRHTGLMDATGIFAAVWVALAVLSIVTCIRLPAEPLSRLTKEQLLELGLDPAVPPGNLA